MVKKVDDAVGYLNWALQAAGLHKKTDVIILSDHGMVTVKPRNFVNLNRWMDKKHCKVYGKSPVCFFLPFIKIVYLYLFYFKFY